MNILKLGIDFFSALFLLIIIQYYFVYVGKKSVISKKKAYILYAVCLVLIVSTSPMANRNLILPILNFTLICIISLSLSGKWYINLFYGVLLFVLLLFSDLVAGATLIFITNMYIGEIQDALSYYVVGALTAKLLAFLLIKILGYKKTERYKSISLHTFLGLLLIPISSIIIFYGLIINIQHYQSQLLMTIFIVVSILTCLSNFLVFYLFENQVENSYIQNRLAFVEKQVDQQQEHYKEIIERQVEVRKLSHDMKNYLSGITGFLNEGNYDEVARCLGHISTEIQGVISEYDTGYPALDALLHIKKKHIDVLRIKFDASIILPEKITVEALDLCVILGNGLDNAIEACEKLNDVQRRFIWLSIHVYAQYVSICIENAMSLEGLPDTFPETSKQDGFNHGFGLKNMQAVVDRYDGNLNISHADGVFQLAVLMKNG